MLISRWKKRNKVNPSFEIIPILKEITPIITHYYDEIKEKNHELINDLEIDFIINVKKDNIDIKLSNEHTDYKWVTKDSKLLDDFIKDKISNI